MVNSARTSFQFTRDFTQGGSGSPYVEAGEAMPVSQQQHLQKLEAVRLEAYAKGFDEGRRQQENAESARLTACLEQLALQFGAALGGFKALEEQARLEAVQFSILFARKLSARLIDAIPVQAVEMTARAIFNDLRGAPHVAVRVAPDLVDLCKARLLQLMREDGLETRLFVFPDPALLLGDCRIEWADGGIVNDRARLEAQIDRSLQALFPQTPSSTTPSKG